MRGEGNTREALEAFNEAITIREQSLSRDPQNARSRSLVAGNYAERGTTFFDAGQTTQALRDLHRAVEYQTALIEVDPKGTPTRIAMADFQCRLAAANATLARKSKGVKSQTYWRESAKYFRRADALYSALSSEGLLQSPQLRDQAKRAAEGAQESDQMLGENRLPSRSAAGAGVSAIATDSFGMMIHAAI